MSNILNEAELKEQYITSLKDIMKEAQSVGVTHEQFKHLFKNSLNSVDCAKSTKRKRALYCIIFMILVLYIVNYLLDEKPLSLFLCKIQEFIYPGLRLLRLISIPIITIFPSLTELYDETCLVQNPFFKIVDMDCWPCYSINQISEISNRDELLKPQTNPPFIYKTNQKRISYSDLQKTYNENKKNFDTNAMKVVVNDNHKILVSEFFRNDHTNGSNSYKWRLTRMLPALPIRLLFPRPDIIPRLGQSTERFVTIDDPKSRSYPLPEPECDYAFVIQSSGERLIELQPSKECLEKCGTVKVLLSAPYMLWYNWWYWRPISHSTEINETSISYVGSYC